MITSKCTLTIDLDIIKKNYQNLQKICSESEVGAAVKANCYGLGVLHITPVLGKYGCRHFFVANQDEGVNLRKILNQQNLTSQIYVLNGYFVADKDDFLESNLIPVLNSLYQLELWQDLAHQLNKKLPCLLHIDTGMNRLGMPVPEVKDLLEYVDSATTPEPYTVLISSEPVFKEFGSDITTSVDPFPGSPTEYSVI